MNNEPMNDQAPESQELATVGTQAVAVPKVPASYVAKLLEENHRAFLEVNEGLDLDYVRMGEWLKVDKKGNFCLSADETVKFGDSIEVLIGQGKKRYMLWGKDDTPEKGQLIVVADTQDEAEAVLGQWLMENPERAADYSSDDISLRYLTMLVMIQDIVEAAKEGMNPRILLHDYPEGDTIGWGQFALRVYNGNYRALGVPTGTAAKNVIVQITTEERKSKADANKSYIGRKFECVGMFRPEDFGIVTE